MKKIFLFFLFALGVQTIVEAQLDHSAFDSLLKKHVSSDGKVDYKGLSIEKAALEAYIKTLSDNTPSATSSKTDKMVFWINAYNALTLKLILSNLPLKTITALDKGKTWDVRRFKIGDKTLSLNDIENTILRPMGDARIHFAINCAAKSCPPLLNAAFTSETLEAKLEARTISFVNNPKAVAQTATGLKVAKIFDWYGKDFTPSVVVFINKYAKKKAAKTAKLEYFEYDWSLNN
jgi:hypothetical protein